MVQLQSEWVQVIKNDILIESNTLRRERSLNIFCGYGNVILNLSLRLARNRNEHADEYGKHQYKHLFQSGRDSRVGDIPVIKSVHVGHLVMWLTIQKSLIHTPYVNRNKAEIIHR